MSRGEIIAKILRYATLAGATADGVIVAKYRGFGERSLHRGWLTATVTHGGHPVVNGVGRPRMTADAPTEEAALAGLLRVAMYEAEEGVRERRRGAVHRRGRAEILRRESEETAARAAALDAEADDLAAKIAAEKGAAAP